MSVIHRKTLGNLLLLHVDADPDGVEAAPEGSLALVDSTLGATAVFQNTDGSTAWARVASTADGGFGYSLSWGANMNQKGYYAVANGIATSPDVSMLNYTSQHIISKDATIKSFSWNTQNGDATTVFKILVDGLVTDTVTIDGADGSYNTLGTDVDIFSAVGIEWDAGTKPNNSLLSIGFE